ncbi:MAG: class I SAM-dependent methyltransferase [Chloroflexi bacterium]|nr:class I SAM-dependent methyltransferase [Chloroflexota bacterium]MBV9133132.1 class I SAM-dependent methyltransferase [Chloroflexota bacterium]MBV9893351.1 class I SAM-dependent methyltransferase [Chloroflexota bacterium]
MTPFGADYAGAYDDLYRDKDYAGECDLLEQVFRQYGDGAVKRVLDLGCGTGGHSAVLAARGYHVVGVDRSADMLQHARERNTCARFEQADITAFDLNETFDAGVIMFAVLGYLTCNSQVTSALQTVRKHLRTGGVLFGDLWYGPAVLAQRPGERVKVIETPDSGKVIRVASSVLETRRDICTVHYQLWRLESQSLVSEVREQHAMRYFFEPELEALLASTGFELLHIGSFPDLGTEPSEQTWNVAFVARAR